MVGTEDKAKIRLGFAAPSATYRQTSAVAQATCTLQRAAGVNFVQALASDGWRRPKPP